MYKLTPVKHSAVFGSTAMLAVGVGLVEPRGLLLLLGDLHHIKNIKNKYAGYIGC